MSTPSSVYKDRSTPGSVEGEQNATNNMPLLTKLSRPYLTQHQIEHLRILSELPSSQYNSMLFHAFNQIDGISHVYKFPIKTIGTAMLLFQKTYLYNKLSNFRTSETTISCLMVASKIEDTPKKARELVETFYNLRGTPVSTAQIEDTRNQVLALERQILETVGFDFRISYPHPYVVKICKELGLSRELGLLAWTISTDSYLTDAPLKFPSHSIALASIILAVKLTQAELEIAKIDYEHLRCKAWHVKNALLDLLELYTHSFNSSTLFKLDHTRDSSTFISIRIDINKELVSEPPAGPQGSVRGLVMRDPKLSDRGTVRYILDWEKNHVSGELLS